MQPKPQREPMTDHQWKRLSEVWQAVLLSLIVLFVMAFMYSCQKNMDSNTQDSVQLRIRDARRETQRQMLKAGCTCPVNALLQGN